MKMCKCSKCKEEVEKTYNFDSDNMGLCWVCYKTMQLKEERDEFWTDED
jgi:formylmethanofuran dehydrogenase subunit E